MAEEEKIAALSESFRLLSPEKKKRGLKKCICNWIWFDIRSSALGFHATIDPFVPRPSSLTMAEDSGYQLSLMHTINAIRSSLKIDASLFLLSTLASLANIYSFTIAHGRAKACLLFAKMYELKRVVVPGPVSCCNFYIMSSVLIFILCLCFFIKTHQNSGYRFNKLWCKFLAAFVPIFSAIDFVLLLKGNQAFCDSFDVNKFCSSEVFHNTDFKTFTPKYLDAYSYLDYCRISLVSHIALCILWISGLIIHLKKHTRRSSPL